LSTRWFPVVEQVNALARGDIDLAFVRPVSNLKGLETQLILEEPFVLGLPEYSPLTETRQVSIADCSEQRVINFIETLAPDYLAIITA
jgi:DNA-binding transcriptional LysR family regulator